MDFNAGNFFPGRIAACDWAGLAAKTADQIKNKRQYDAEQQRRGEWKVNRGVLTSVKNVSGQAADGQVRSSEQHEDQSRSYQQRAQNQQDLSEIGHLLI